MQPWVDMYIGVRINHLLENGKEVERSFVRKLAEPYPETPLPGDVLYVGGDIRDAKEITLSEAGYVGYNDVSRARLIVKLAVESRHWVTGGVILSCSPGELNPSTALDMMEALLNIGFDELPKETHDS